MAKAVCPKCKKDRVIPSLARNSHNNCLHCGHTDFVAAFYPPAAGFRSISALDPVQAEDRMDVPRSQPFPHKDAASNDTGIDNGRDHPPRGRYWWQDDNR